MKIFHRMALTAATCEARQYTDGSRVNILGGESWLSITGLNTEYVYKQKKNTGGACAATQ